MAELAERLPEGAEEIVLGRRVSASGRTSAFVAGPRRHRRRPEAARRPAARLLRPARAPQADDLPRRRWTCSTGSPATSTWGCASATARRTASACGWPPSWPSCASATARGSATSTSTATSSPRSRRSRPTPPRRRSWRPSASGCATPRDCARRRRGRTPARPGPTRTAAGRRALWPRPRRCCRASAGVDAALDAIAERARRPRGRARRRRRRAARLRRGGRGRPGAAGGGRGTARRARPAAAQARRQRRVGARPRRALPGGDRAARGRRGARRRGRGGAWPRPKRAARSSAGELSAGRAEAAAPLEERVAEELERLAMPGATLEVVLEPHPDGFGAGGAETVELRMAPEPGHRGGAAARRGLRRRAVARDARALRARRRRRRRHARLRRDRRRRGRQHRADRRRAAAGARRRAAR